MVGTVMKWSAMGIVGYVMIVMTVTISDAMKNMNHREMMSLIRRTYDMNRNDQILLFLGRIQARIEDLGALASDTRNPLFGLIAELEHYFNKSIHEIFSHEDNGNSTWRKGITWNTLPR